MAGVPADIPTWVAVVGALFTMGIIPLGKLMLDYSKQKWEAMKERQKHDDEDEDKFMSFLKDELSKARDANSACEQKYMELNARFTKLSARCARLEAVIIHLHPEVAEDLLKETPSV